jgi:hypothetical protein
MNQRVEEIEAKPYRNGQSDDRLCHGALPLKLPKGKRVRAHQRQNRNTERNEHSVEHDRLLAGCSLPPSRISFRSRIECHEIRKS